MIALAIALTGCSSESSEKVTDAKAARALAEDFFADIAKQDRYKMTTISGGQVYSEVTYDGENVKMHYTDEELSDLYLFVEDGLKYVMYEGSDPYQDDSTYDMYYDMSNMGMKTFVDALVGEDNGDIGIEAELVKNKDNNKETKDFTLKATGTQDGVQSTVTLKGNVTGDKFMGYSYESKSGDQTSTYEVKYEYGDDISVEIPEHEIKKPREYTHVESPYATMGDVIAKLGADNFHNVIMDGTIYSIVDTLQVSASIPEDIYAQLEELDVFDDDYSQKVNDLVSDLAIDDCIDFGEYVLSEDELDSYTGRNVSDLIDEGFEGNGWSIWDEGSLVWVEKDGMEYEADIKLPEGFDAEADFEFEDLYEATVEKMRFNEISFAEIPLR